MSSEPVRGVIDRFEGDYAVVALDDGQQLDWPRSTLPSDARPGVAVVLSLSPVSKRQEDDNDVSAQTTPGWQGELTTEKNRWVIHLANGQELDWPTPLVTAAQSGGRVSLQLVVDVEDTEARRKRVANLLDDIFGAK